MILGLLDKNLSISINELDSDQINYVTGKVDRRVAVFGEICNMLFTSLKRITMWEDKLKIYDELVAKCPRFKRKGKSMPYTSANGYMFSLLNKAGEIGIRFSKELQKKYMKAFDSTLFKSHVATMQGYVLIPEAMLEDLDNVAKYLNESYDYVMELEPK